MRNIASVPMSVHSSRPIASGAPGAVVVDERRPRRRSEPRARASRRSRRRSMLASARIDEVEQRHLVPVRADRAGARRPRSPPRSRRAAAAGSAVPSTTGWNGRPPPAGVDRRSAVIAASMICSVVSARSASMSPAFDAERVDERVRAMSAARSRVAHHDDAPLCGIALWNRPRAAGRPSSVPTRPAAGRLAEDRDVVRVAAERGDAVAHPLERGDLVEDARRCRSLRTRRRTGRRGAGSRTARGGS